MKQILTLIDSGVCLWDELYDPDITRFFLDTPIIGKGSTGVVYDVGAGRVCKVQKLYKTPSTCSNHELYKKYDSIVYIKESFLLEALIMQELYGKSSIIPKVFDTRFGYVDNHFVSIVVMEKRQGKSYIPFILPLEELVPMVSLFLKELETLYHSFSFIHGDLITDNMILSNSHIQPIDFGLSSCRLDGVLYCRFHSFHDRLLPTLLQDQKMLSQLR
jgi:serine/threonine protein kinase